MRRIAVRLVDRLADRPGVEVRHTAVVLLEEGLHTVAVLEGVRRRIAAVVVVGRPVISCVSRP